MAPSLQITDLRIVNALTIDVEDYFQVSAMAPYIPRSQWNTIPCRIEHNIARILAMLEAHNVKATFFTLGWIAERYPKLVRQLAAEGHEIASHGYSHELATSQSPEAFLADIRLAKMVLEDITGSEAKGYRAPSFSIGAGNRWASACIEQAGYQYSSSVYPIVHDHYGMPDSPRFSHVSFGKLLEIPLTTVRMFHKNLPAAGGGYFRLLPYFISRWCIGHVNVVDKQPAIFYFHPWEVDPEQPRVPGINAKTRFRHYVNLGRMEVRLRRLLQDFKWGRADNVFLDHCQHAA